MDTSILTGHKHIDDQHIHLLNTIEYYNVSCDFNDVVGIDRVFNRLLQYIEYHFKYEERLYSDVPENENHMLMHRLFEHRVNVYKEKFEESDSKELRKEFSLFLHKWLINHICKEDIASVAWVRENQPDKFNEV